MGKLNVNGTEIQVPGIWEDSVMVKFQTAFFHNFTRTRIVCCMI